VPTSASYPGRSRSLECSFEAAIKGAFYADETRVMLAEGRICEIDIDPEVRMYTAWDKLLWRNGSTIPKALEALGLKTLARSATPSCSCFSFGLPSSRSPKSQPGFVTSLQSLTKIRNALLLHAGETLGVGLRERTGDAVRSPALAY
jgi:hypothetical protein